MNTLFDVSDEREVGRGIHKLGALGTIDSQRHGLQLPRTPADHNRLTADASSLMIMTAEIAAAPIRKSGALARGVKTFFIAIRFNNDNTLSLSMSTHIYYDRY